VSGHSVPEVRQDIILSVE